MKFITFIFKWFTSLATVAALGAPNFGYAEDENVAIRFQPHSPVDCQSAEAPNVNWIYLISKTNETSENVEFAILAQDGYCHDGEFHERALDTKNLSISIHENVIAFPWWHEPVKVEYEGLPNNVLRARFNFNLKQIFKKRSKGLANAVFYMRYYPSADARFSYQWTLVLTRDANNQLNLRVSTRSI